MATLTSQSTFTVGESGVETASINLTILPALGSGTGKGRLIHPTLGTYDYEKCPDEWANVDGDVIIPPVWASSKTLDGVSNTLFAGNIRDVIVEERWTDDVSAPLSMVRALISFWQNPPDPAIDFIRWYPNYVNALGFKVILVSLDLNGQGINFDWFSRNGYVHGVLSLRMRIVARI